jgi:hypothetical protein
MTTSKIMWKKWKTTFKTKMKDNLKQKQKMKDNLKQKQKNERRPQKNTQLKEIQRNKNSVMTPHPQHTHKI